MPVCSKYLDAPACLKGSILNRVEHTGKAYSVSTNEGVNIIISLAKKGFLPGGKQGLGEDYGGPSVSNPKRSKMSR